jgi:hypothetical protein
MGCICSKGGRANNFLDNNVRRKEKNKPAKRLVSLSRKDEVVVEVDGSANDATASLISNQPGNDNVEYAPVSSDEGEKKEIIEKANNRMSSSIVSMSNGERGAQVVAGWPSWLTAVAGEAINGWVPRRADSFEKLDKVSLVYVSMILVDFVLSIDNLSELLKKKWFHFPLSMNLKIIANWYIHPVGYSLRYIQ